MNITVTKSSPVLVGPSSPPPPAGHDVINLTSFDMALAFFPVTSFHVFTHAILEPAETVRRALSDALVHYYPVAGRLVVADGGGALRITCTGEGVAFVSATADRSLADVKLLDPPFGGSNQLMRDLSTGLPAAAAGFRPTDPLLLVQVTEFACGGFVLAVTRNHAVAYGTGFAQLLRAVGELARGLPHSTVLPVSCGDTSLPPLPPAVAALERALLTLAPREFAYLDITVPSACIDRVKSGFLAGDDEEEPCTVFEAVVAVLWRCRTRAVLMSDPAAPAPLVFAASVRKQVGAKRGYYGNCITSAVAVPTSGEVARGSVRDVVRLIKRAKRRTLRQFTVSGEEEEDEEEEPGCGSSTMEEMEEEEGVMFGYNALDVTSWRNLGANAVDLGGGRPARVMFSFDRMPVPYCVACPPCVGKDGANVLARCVREEHVDAFLGELAEFVSDDVY